jgi:hypothetical protein
MRVYNVWHAVLDNDIVYMDMRGPRKILEERLRAQALQLESGDKQVLATLDDGFELNALIREAYGLEMESQKRKLSVGGGRPGELFSGATRVPESGDDEVTPRRNRSKGNLQESGRRQNLLLDNATH